MNGHNDPLYYFTLIINYLQLKPLPFFLPTGFNSKKNITFRPKPNNFLLTIYFADDTYCAAEVCVLR
jgi:hypothetical protein